jgi:hypothetical protein
MSVTTRLCIFAAIAVASFIAWQWHASTGDTRDATQLAVQQFQNDSDIAVRLQEASHAQNWWPFIWPALLLLLAVVLFWDDVEGWWKQDEA